MKKYLKLMRVKHYIKNILVFLPFIFSGQFFQPFYLFQPLRSKLLILTHRLLGGG